MKTAPQIAKMMGISCQRLNYWLDKPGCPKPELRVKKRQQCRYYDEVAVLDFCRRNQPTLTYGHLVTLSQAARLCGTYFNKMERALKKDDAPDCIYDGYRKLFDKEEIVTWWSER